MIHLGPRGRYLLGGVLALAVYAVVPDGLANTALFVAIGYSAAVAILVGIRQNRPLHRGPWLWFAFGLAGNVTGRVVETVLIEVFEVSAWPSVADAFYLSMYPCVVFGLVQVIRERTRHGEHASLLDASIISTGLGLISWVFLMQPLASGASPWLERLVSFSYPVGDLLVLAIIIRLLASAGVRSGAFYMMTASLGLFLLGNFGWATFNHIGYEPGWVLRRALDEVFLSAYVLFGASALHPSMADVGERDAAPALRLSRRRLLLLMAASLVAPGLMVLEEWRGAITDGFAIAASSVALFTFVVARMALLVRQLEAQSRQLDFLARIDSLTGVSNRRVLDEKLPEELERAKREDAPVAVAIIDLDNFKEYNDHNGHTAGDHLLQTMVEVWQTRLRSADHLVRYGGDEFVVILPAADRAQASAIAARLGSANSTGQTMSIGVAVWDGRESADELLYRADHSLFEAKRGGRDRIVVADPVPAPAPA